MEHEFENLYCPKHHNRLIKLVEHRYVCPLSDCGWCYVSKMKYEKPINDTREYDKCTKENTYKLFSKLIIDGYNFYNIAKKLHLAHGTIWRYKYRYEKENHVKLIETYNGKDEK